MLGPFSSVCLDSVSISWLGKIGERSECWKWIERKREVPTGRTCCCWCKSAVTLQFCKRREGIFSLETLEYFWFFFFWLKVLQVRFVNTDQEILINWRYSQINRIINIITVICFCIGVKQRSFFLSLLVWHVFTYRYKYRRFLLHLISLKGKHTHTHTHTVGLLRTRDRSIEETYIYTTNTSDRHPCSRQDSNPQSQQQTAADPALERVATETGDVQNILQ